MWEKLGRGVFAGVGVAVRSTAAPLVLGMRWMSGRTAPGDGVPATRWSPALAGKAALDEVFFASELILANVVSHRGALRTFEEVPAALELFEKRGWLRDPAGYHQDPPPLRDVRIDSASSGLVRFEHVRFDSGYEPHDGEPGRQRWLAHTANRTAHAWLLEHPGPPRPWLICVPGYRMGHPLVDFTGFRARWLHTELGLNVAIPVMPLHGPRRTGRRGGDGFFSGDFLDTIHAQAQAIWDIRRLAGWLADRGAPALGVYGVSLGGHTAALMACLDEELACVVAGIPATDFVRLIAANVPSPLFRAARWAGFSVDDIAQLVRVVSPLVLEPRVDRRHLFVYAGLADQLATPDHAHDLWNHWGRPHIHWYQGSHMSFMWEKKVQRFLAGAFRRSGLMV